MYDFNKSLLKEIGERFLVRKETIATAESVTSGLMQFAISNIPDASTFFQGGITAYNLEQKVKHLHVERDHAAAVNCVSEEVANEMALETCKIFDSNWGIGITGYASPVPESDGKLFAHYAIAYNNKILYCDKIESYETDPALVRLYYVNTVIEILSIKIRK
jgi:nicotinamide-nucleotide amidase